MQLTEANRHDEAPGWIRLGAVIGALRRRKWLILGPVLVVNALVVAALMVLPSRYSATAMLVIEPPARVPGEADGGSTGDATMIQTQVNLLRSPSLAKRVIVELGLAQDPELVPEDSRRARLHRLLASLPLAGGLAEWVPLPPPPAGLTPEQAVVPGFLGRLSVSRLSESRVVAVSFASQDREKAAQVANAVAAQYLSERLAFQMHLLDTTRQWVRERAEELRRQLRQAEADVVDYMAEHGLARVGPAPPDAQEPPSLRREMAAARADRAMREARLAQLRSLQERGESPAALPEVGGSVIIQHLQQQASLVRAREAQALTTFGVNHPSLRELRSERAALDQRIAAETNNIVRGIVEDAARARARERDMELQLGESVERDMSAERAAVRLAELTRVVDTKSTQYRALLVRLEELDERRELARPGAEIISAATVPRDRDFPSPGILLGGGLLGSLALGLGLAALREQQDSRLRAGHHVEQALGLKNLALVPRVRSGAKGGLHRYARAHPQSAYAEALRTLALAVDRFSAASPAKVLLVTSALPGEGKTTLAVGLAATMAQRGRRVVIVDLDLRRPSVARQLGLPQNAGLVDFIEGRRTLQEVVQPVGPDRAPQQAAQPPGRRECLEAVAVHRHSDNPGALLDSPRLQALVEMLRRDYDTVVLDAPPSLGITDAATIALLADCAIFVARWGATTGAAARLGVAALADAGLPVLGCALTQVDLKRHARYGYQDVGEYYSSYRRYFRQ